jgi:hypothetical protein
MDSKYINLDSEINRKYWLKRVNELYDYEYIKYVNLYYNILDYDNEINIKIMANFIRNRLILRENAGQYPN